MLRNVVCKICVEFLDSCQGYHENFVEIVPRPQYIVWMYLNCTRSKNPIELRMGRVHSCQCMGNICSLFKFPSKRVPNEVVIRSCRTATCTLEPVCNCRHRQRGRGGQRSRTQRGDRSQCRRFYLDSREQLLGRSRMMCQYFQTSWKQALETQNGNRNYIGYKLHGNKSTYKLESIFLALTLSSIKPARREQRGFVRLFEREQREMLRRDENIFWLRWRMGGRGA